MVRADIADVPSRLPELLALALGGEEVRFTERDRDVLSLSSLEEKTADESPEERRRREAHEGDLEILRRQVPLTREQMLALGIIPGEEPASWTSASPGRGRERVAPRDSAPHEGRRVRRTGHPARGALSYWDTSALAPMLRSEPTSSQMRSLFATDPNPLTSWITLVEVLATIARWNREDVAGTGVAGLAAREWTAISGDIGIVVPSDDLVTESGRLLGLYTLRGMDAIQLSSWSVGSRQATTPVPIVTLDRRLRDAARAEGATVLPILV